MRVGCAVVDPDGPLGFWRQAISRGRRAGCAATASTSTPRTSGTRPACCGRCTTPTRTVPSRGSCAPSWCARSPTTAARPGGRVPRRLAPRRHVPARARKDVDRPVDPRRPGTADRPATLVAEAFLGGALLGPGDDATCTPWWPPSATTCTTSSSGGPVRWGPPAGADLGALPGPAGARRAAARPPPRRRRCARWSPPRRRRRGRSRRCASATATRPGGRPARQMSDDFPSTVDTVLASDIAAAGFEPGVSISPFLRRARPRWRRPTPTDRPTGSPAARRSWACSTSAGRHRRHARHARTPRRWPTSRAWARPGAAGFRHPRVDFASAPSSAAASTTRCTPAQRVGPGSTRSPRASATTCCWWAPACRSVRWWAWSMPPRPGPNAFPSWDHDAVAFPSYEGYTQAKPAIRHAVEGAVTRSFQHRMLWSNDPDCFLLEASTDLLPAAVVPPGVMSSRAPAPGHGLGRPDAHHAERPPPVRRGGGGGRETDAAARAGTAGARPDCSSRRARPGSGFPMESW